MQVCSPTRATVLTGRNHFRDCVDYVYGCSDMTECVPNFNFAPQRTYTAPMAVRDSGKGYSSWFGGKWHLGSFYNDSEKYGGRYDDFEFIWLWLSRLASLPPTPQSLSCILRRSTAVR